MARRDKILGQLQKRTQQEAKALKAQEKRRAAERKTLEHPAKPPVLREKLPEGYAYRRVARGDYVIVRTPGNRNLPPMRLVDGKPTLVSDIPKPTGKIHKNSNDYVGETHLYAIKREGKIVKYGETATGFNKKGQLKRAQKQVKKLEDEHPGEKIEGDPVRVFTSKREARTGPRGETKYIETHKKVFGPNSLPLNKGNR